MHQAALTFVVVIVAVLTSWVTTSPAAEPAEPRDPVADAAKIDELTRAMLEGDYKARLKACSALVMLPRGSRVQEDLLLDKAFPACAADAEWRLRAAAARTVGSRYLSNDTIEPTDPRAVALCVKLAADENAKVRHDAVYFGLSPMRDKPDEVIAALVKAAIASPAQGEGSDVAGRVSWGLQGVAPETLAPHVAPYLTNYEKEPQPAQSAYALFVNATKTEPPGAEAIEGGGPFIVRLRIEAPVGGDPEAALALIRKHVPVELVPVIFIEPGRTNAGAYALAPDIKTRRAVIEKLKGVEHVEVSPDVMPATPEMVAHITKLSKVPPRLLAEPAPAPEPSPLAPGEDLREVLLTGGSKRREAIFRYIRNPMSLTSLSRDEAGLDVLEACADDPSPFVRGTVAGLLNAWVWSRDPQHPRGIALAIKLAADPEPSVSNEAVYNGLSTVKSPMSDEVIRALAATAVRQPLNEPFHGRIAWGLRNEKPERLAPFFEPYLKDADDDRAANAYMTFVHATGYEPPNAERFAPLATFMLLFGQSRDSKHTTPAALLAAFREYAPESKVPEVAVYQNGDFAQGTAVLKDLATLRALSAEMKEDPEFNVESRPIVLSPARLSYLRARLGQDPARTISSINAPPVTYDEVLRDLHAHLGRVYPAFAIKGIDWHKVGEELLPLAKDVKTDAEFGLLCAQMVARLEDSHAQLQPGSAPIPAIEFPRFDPGFACLIDDRDRPVVYHVDKGSPADTGGVKVGMTVVAVNGKPAAEAIAAWMQQQRKYVGYSSERYLRYDAAKGFYRQMKPGEVVKLEMEDVEGKPHAFALPATLDVRYLPRLPVPIEGIRDAGAVESKALGNSIGYIYVRRIRPDLPQALDVALKQLGEIKGLIIDVRGNSGGGFDARAAVQNFNPEDTANPERPRYHGPTALLIDERCISAGEGWASWFVAKKRATLFGSATAGASARKDTYTLTNGLYKVVVPVKAYTGSLDRPIERRGLEPDVPVRSTAADLAAGRDTVLEAAREHLMKK